MINLYMPVNSFLLNKNEHNRTKTTINSQIKTTRGNLPPTGLNPKLISIIEIDF